MPTICHWMTVADELKSKPQKLHRERRRGHQHIHHAIPNRRRDDRNDKDRCTHDFNNRAACAAESTIAAGFGIRINCNVHSDVTLSTMQSRQNSQKTSPPIGLRSILGKLGPTESCEQSPCHHVRDRTGTEILGRHICCSKPVILPERIVDT